MSASEHAPVDRDSSKLFPFPDLFTPAAFPHAVRAVRLVETYISWILLTGEFAYKIKKPVRFDFLDAGTLERRRELCEDELRLNQRLAPDLYLRVAALTRDASGVRVDGSGPIIEYAVCMREFPARDVLDQRLAQGTVLARDLAAFGARLVDFHLRAAVAAADNPYGGYDEVRHQVLGNLGTLISNPPGDEALRSLTRLADWSHSAVAALEPLIRLRKDSGAVRECHGDLHARNLVFWRGELTPFDCLEFSPALRWIDVVSDVAFLFMDLLAHERADLAFAFLNGYLEQGGDYEGLRLLRFYAVYRALVRAKVDALAVLSAAPGVVAELRDHLRKRLQLAARFLDPSQPALIIMNGVTACGKTRVSAELAQMLGAVRIRSDLERKRLTGTTPLSHRSFDVGRGDYDEASSNRTYARLAECAEAALASGYHVVVDAAFLDRGRRELFHAFANERHCPFLIVACDAPRGLLHKRIAERAAAGNDASEATAAVLEHQLKSHDALTAHELTHTILVQTDVADSPASAVAAARAWLARAAPCRSAVGAAGATS